ncbi:MAG: pantoate--beta-alanine ligase [Actinomycetota bacterium]
MEVIREADAYRERMVAARGNGATVGLVPTMGAFHPGHLSLMERARAENDLVAVSIFVNRLQFGPGEDFERYPRNEEADVTAAERQRADVAFVPTEEEMLGTGAGSEAAEVTVDPGPIGDRFEGASRPGHFRGVLQVVARLLSLTGRSRAYLGEKDFQQLFLVRSMVRDLAIDAEIVACPTVREPGGLALSSRNVHLDERELDVAGVLFEALADAAERVRTGARHPQVLVAEMAKTIAANEAVRLDYVAVVDEETFEEPVEIQRPSRAIVAAHVGSVRLIDNIRLDPA